MLAINIFRKSVFIGVFLEQLLNSFWDDDDSRDSQIYAA